MRFLTLWLLMLAGAAQAAPPCHREVVCPLDGRGYHVLEPDGWDGVSPLPVLLHFHGWQRQGTLVVRHRRIAGATRRRGVLLVAPNGDRRTWDFWTDETPDVEFAEAVLKDVRGRWPVDEARIFVSGYSFGSAMAWRFVCERGNGIAALIAVSGTLGQSETCPQFPREVRHVHGLSDTVMDFPMGPGGDRTYPVALWRDAFGCKDGETMGQWNAVSFLTFERTVWSCDHGSVSLDIHPGGHFIPHGWIGRQLDEILGLPPTYP